MDKEFFYSPEVDDIMNKAQPKVLKLGWVILICIFSFMIGGCFFIRYPRVSAYQITLNLMDSTSLEIIGIFTIVSEDVDKFSVGKHLSVKLTEYSFLEYGTMGGQIQSVEFNPAILKYVVVVSFPQRLKTSIGKSVGFKNGMTGYCEVVVGKDRLIGKIFPVVVKFKEWIKKNENKQ